jgi:stress-induced morphogen
MMCSTIQRPLYSSIKSKLSALDPKKLEIIDNSHLHAHHAAMRGNTNPETHFAVTIISNQFEGKVTITCYNKQIITTSN